MDTFRSLVLVTAMGLVPAITSVILYLLIKRTKLSKLNYWVSQTIIGVIFGAIAIFSTEYGVYFGGGTINVRDAAPLCAGLIFGAPAGLISAVIGAVERGLAAMWGVGQYTQWACVLGTLAAGIIGALVKKFMFNNRAVKWFYGLSVGIVVETLHMLMVFLTHLDDIETAYGVVSTAYLPMAVACSASVTFATLIVYVLDREFYRKDSIYNKEERKKPTITSVFQFGLLLLMLLCFVLTTAFLTVAQTNLANHSAVKLMNLNASDVVDEIEKESDKNLLDITRNIAKSIDDFIELKKESDVDITINEFLNKTLEENDISEISIIDENGIIVYSTTADFVGFDMSSGDQSKEFLCLLEDTDIYVQTYQPIAYDNAISYKYAGAKLKSGGFVQTGFNAERFQRDINDKVKGITETRRIGEKGYIIVANSKWEIVSDPTGTSGLNLNVVGVWIDTKTMPEGKIYRDKINGVDSLWCYHTIEGYYILSIIPEDEAFFYRNIGIYELFLMEILLFSFLFILIFFLNKKIVGDNFREVNIGLNKITGGDLDVKIEVSKNREFEALSNGINTTVDKLKDYIAEAEQRIDAELKYAKEIQHSVLPNVFPPFPEHKEIDIFAKMKTAKQVGGDFYDFFMLPQNRLAFVVADVSGKGIPAAMFMMRSRTLIKNFAEMELSVDEILYKANNKICEHNESNMFVTAWVGILDLKTGVVDFVNAGHNFPLVKLSSSFEYLETTPSFILGGMSDFPYKKYSVTLKAGDMLYLYTDGVTEAQDIDGNLYGESRLHKFLNDSKETDVEIICNNVMEDVKAYAGKAEQSDDITMMCIRYNGADGDKSDNVVTIPVELTGIDTVNEFIDNKLKACKTDESVRRDIAVINDEIISNIVNYGYEDKTDKTITVRIDELSDIIKITYIDSGIKYNPLEKSDPDVTLSAKQRTVGGLGIFLVKKMTDNMTYYYEDGKNHLQIEKSLV